MARYCSISFLSPSRPAVLSEGPDETDGPLYFTPTSTVHVYGASCRCAPFCLTSSPNTKTDFTLSATLNMSLSKRDAERDLLRFRSNTCERWRAGIGNRRRAKPARLRTVAAARPRPLQDRRGGRARIRKSRTVAAAAAAAAAAELQIHAGRIERPCRGSGWHRHRRRALRRRIRLLSHHRSDSHLCLKRTRCDVKQMSLNDNKSRVLL